MVPELSPVIRFRRKLHWKAAYWWYSPFMLQWLVLIVFSTIQYHRFALTHDFAIYWQALWLIAHGHLNPYSTIAGFPFLDNHFELILWPLAIFYWLWPHASLLLYMQNSALVGGEMIAWSWLNSWVTRQPASWQSWFRITGLILLVANPWVYWTAAFDFHSESLMVLTVTGMAYALWRRNHRLLVLWTLGTLSIGDVAALLVTGLGLTALALRRWKTGVSLVTSGILWLGLVESIGADKGSILAPSYGYLASGIAHLTLTTLVLHLTAHPGPALHVLWQRRANLWANMSPAGFLGVFSPWGIGVVLTALLPSSMTSYILFSEPGFQNIPVMGLITLGSVFTLAWIGRRVRWRFTVPLLSLVLLINMVGWAIFWLPRIPSTWIRVGPEQSHTLNTIRHLIPASAEVIAPQAVIGRFAGRSTVYPMMGSTAFPLTPHVPHYVVMAPYQGIHLGSIALMASQLEDLAQMSRARLIGEHQRAPRGSVADQGVHEQIGPSDISCGRAPDNRRCANLLPSLYPAPRPVSLRILERGYCLFPSMNCSRLTPAGSPYFRILRPMS